MLVFFSGVGDEIMEVDDADLMLSFAYARNKPLQKIIQAIKQQRKSNEGGGLVQRGDGFDDGAGGSD